MIQTVRGAISADDLGVTVSHDHVLSDSSRLRRDGAAPGPMSDVVDDSTRDYLRTNALALADNLRLDDPDLAVAELRPAVAAGQSAVIECTSWGLGPDHARLPAISLASGMAIVVAYGAYLPSTHPDAVARMTASAFEEDVVRALEMAVPGTDYRAGLIGIMGTTAGFVARERDLLAAAARAGVRTGAAVSVRLDPDARNGLDVIEAMTAEGLEPERIVLTNADEYLDATYWAALAATGAVLEMCFGTEDSHGERVVNPTDAERLDFFVAAVTASPSARHVLGQSVWTKRQLRAHGGYGYAHVVGSILPELVARGIAPARIDRMIVDEPRRLLDR